MSDRAARADEPAAAEETETGTPTAPREDLEELRELILGPEQALLRELKDRLDNLELRAEDVGRVLAEAVALRTARDNRLTIALIPTVEETVKASIRKDPATFESILSPVIGQTIRNAMADALQAKLQSFNRTLVRSLSWRGVKWRLEALRTGKPFEEVVLLHSLLYRVEQVLLIHRETGLILQHMVAPELESFQDADIVSGMLTAIQDFARDSFDMGEGDVLQTFQVGELTVWVAQGEMALLAAVIRGEAPEGLRVKLQQALEVIHFEKGEALKSFDGETAAFDDIRHALRACFEEEFQRRRRFNPVPWLLFFLLMAGLGVAVYLGVDAYLRTLGPDTDAPPRKVVTKPVAPAIPAGDRIEALVDRLRKTPGIAVTGVAAEGGKYRITGFRDPLAPEPESLIGEGGPAPDRIIFELEPYQTLHPDFILNRARTVLKPPPGVDLRFEEGALIAEGLAPHDWIERAGVLAHALSGVESFDTDGLVDRSVRAFEEVQAEIEKTVIGFIFNTARVRPDQEAALEAVLEKVRRLERLGEKIDAAYVMEIVGHTDSTGTELRNEALSRERAARARQLLIQSGMDPDRIRTVGVADKEPVRPENSEADKAMNRSVTFRFIRAGAGTGERP